MVYLHCQVRFKDYSVWKSNMEADAEAQEKAGIFVKQIWRGLEDENIAFFVCEVEDIERARKFFDPDDIAKAEEEAGASDFQWYFVEQV